MTERIRPRQLLAGALVVLSLLLVPALSTAQTPTAQGTFESDGVGFRLAGAYAFRHDSIARGGEPAILVAISNADFEPEMINRYYDRRWLIETYHPGEQTGLVLLEFRPNGGFYGYSFQLMPGNGCGFCGSSAVKSTVKLDGDRLVGNLSATNAEATHGVSFDITLDVPIQPDDHGEPAPLDGDVGKAYLAYHEALSSRDTSALRERFSSYQVSVWDELTAEGKGNSFVTSWADDHPDKVTLKKIFAKADSALILIEAERSSIELELKGEVIMVREDGTWRVDDEVFQLR